MNVHILFMKESRVKWISCTEAYIAVVFSVGSGHFDEFSETQFLLECLESIKLKENILL